MKQLDFINDIYVELQQAAREAKDSEIQINVVDIASLAWEISHCNRRETDFKSMR